MPDAKDLIPLLRGSWEQFVASLPDAVICTDQAGRITLTNAVAQGLLGYSAEELKQRHLKELLPQCPGCEAFGTPNHNCIATPLRDEAWLQGSCEVMLQHKNGNSVPALLSSSRIAAPDNPKAYINLTTVKDTSRFKQAEKRIEEEKTLFQALFNNFSDAVFLAPLSPEGVHGNFVEVNDVACGRLGYSRDEFLTMNARTLNPAANLGKVKAFGRNIRREGKAIFEAIHVTKDGTQFPVEVVAKYVQIGGRDYVLSVVRDLREHKMLQKAESRFGRLLDHSWDEIYVFESESLLFLQVNQGALDNLGYTKKELQELTITDITPKMSEKDFHTLTRPLFDGSESRLIYETTYRRKDGSTYPVEIRLQLSHSEVPPVFLANVQDITHRKEIERRLTYLAWYDSLTGLPNRSLFLDRLNMALQNCRRTNTLVAVIFLDLDGFKFINDTLGHDAGDALIKEVGRRVDACVRRSDTVARLGGDEFTVILTNLKEVAGAETVARKIIKAVAEPFMLNEQEVCATTSLGITIYPLSDNDDAYELVKQADSAMYQAKAKGKNNYQFYAASLAQDEIKRLKMENALKRALTRGEMHLHYQPRVNLESTRVIGAEALLRWDSPDFGSVPPNEFIPLIEASGRMQEIGIWVLREACAQLRVWLNSERDFRMSVNVSARQIEAGDFPEQVQRILNETGVPPSHVEIEITEGLLVSQSDEAANALRALKDIGVMISLDDFGTGYSSLNYLKRFPIDILKIDRSFVMDLGREEDSRAIVQAIIGLAHSLRLKVTAEGIEDIDKVAFLKERGCDEGQGFFFGKPMPSDQFERVMAEQWSRDNDTKDQSIN